MFTAVTVVYAYMHALWAVLPTAVPGRRRESAGQDDRCLLILRRK